MKKLSTALENIQNGVNPQEDQNNILSMQAHGSQVDAGRTNCQIQNLIKAAKKMAPDAIDKELKVVARSLQNLSITFRDQSLWKNEEFIGVRTTPVITEKSDRHSLQELYRVTEDMCSPSGSELVMKEIYALSVVMARRKDEDLDYKVLVSVYAKDLEEYPSDIVIAVCREVRRSQKFFPTISELRESCAQKFEFRKSLLREISMALSGGKYLSAG